LVVDQFGEGGPRDDLAVQGRRDLKRSSVIRSHEDILGGRFSTSHAMRSPIEVELIDPQGLGHLLLP
jgi:hypothetical protein